jgi:hypothetical protein
LVRSFQVAGFGAFAFAASAVLKQMTARNASMPTQLSGFLPLLKIGFRSFEAGGVYGSSSPCASNSAMLEAASPQTMSARGLSFSARKRAVTTPVESRTQTISTVGLSASNACL